MTKWAIIVFGLSVATAAWAVNQFGCFAGLVIGIILLPAFFAAQFIFVKWIMGDKQQ
jgi:hypothetical protein